MDNQIYEIELNLKVTEEFDAEELMSLLPENAKIDWVIDNEIDVKFESTLEILTMVKTQIETLNSINIEWELSTPIIDFENQPSYPSGLEE